MNHEDESTPAPSVVIGITGNIGSGKSTVSMLLRSAGHIVYSSDETAQRIMTTNDGLKDEIKRSFGDDVYHADGSVDRSKLANLVFGETSAHHARLAQLNRLVHPRVLEEHQRQIEECFNKGIKLVFVESALLFEVGLEDAFDYIVVVDAPEKIRLERALARTGQTEAGIRHRMREQLSSDLKTRSADFVIDNSTSPEALGKAVRSLLPILELLPPRELMDEGGETDDSLRNDEESEN